MPQLFTADEVRALLRAACNEAGSARKWANANGVSDSHVSRFLDGQYMPGPRIEKALGLVQGWRLDSDAARS